MTELAEVVAYLDDYLRIREIPDAPHALNGLQLSNAGTVSRVAAAVDLCRATVQMAAEQGADLLLVHHGLFWGGLRTLTGRDYGRVAALARQLGLSARGTFGEEYGVAIGVWGEVEVSRAALERQLATVLGVAARVMPFGPERAHRVGIVTGAAGSMIAQAAAAGLDSF